MGRMLLQDTMTVRLSLNEDNGSGKMTATGVFGRADVPTANNRIYPRSLWEREINRLQRPISERKVLSEVDHPDSGKTKLSRTAGLLTALSINENGDIIGTMEVLDTASGKDLKALIDGGASVGVSSRGYGSVKLNNEGKDVVQDDFQCQTFDFVADPAHQMAYPEFSTSAADAPAEESKKAVKAPLTETNPQAAANIQEMDVQMDTEKKPEVKTCADKKDDEVVAPKEAEGEPEVKADPEDKGDKDDDDSEENSEPKKLMDAENEKLISQKPDAGAQESVDLEQLKKDFELRLVAAVKESEAVIRAQVIAEMEADSGLAGAKLALERTKEILAPYVLPKDVETEMMKRDAKIIEQAKVIGSLQSKNRQFEAVCKDMGFSLYLERKLSKHPKFGEIKVGLGDLTKMESLDALKARVLIYEQELPKIQESWKAGRRATVEDYESRIEGLVEELAEAKLQIKKVTEERVVLSKERDEAVQIGLDSAAQAYLEQRIAGMPEAPGIRKTFRLLECKTKDKIDSLVEGYENSRRSSGSDFTQIRKRLGGRVQANLVQESLEGTLIEHSRFEIENKEVDSLEVVDGVRVSMDEIRKLSGMSLK